VIRIQLDGAAIGETEAPDLPPVSVDTVAENPSFLAVAGDRAPLYASLVAGGRMSVDRGSVAADGSADVEALRVGVALVDTPVVAEPTADLPVSVIVAEELAFAERPHGKGDVASALEGLGLRRYLSVPLAAMPPTERTRMLAELAVLRRGVQALILTSPERHGGPTEGWLAVAADFAARGYTVLVIAGHAAVDTARRAADTSPPAAPNPVTDTTATTERSAS
jgi:ABC-2 type transport system ATP-binding protein